MTSHTLLAAVSPRHARNAHRPEGRRWAFFCVIALPQFPQPGDRNAQPKHTGPMLSERWQPGGDLRTFTERATLPAIWAIGIAVATQTLWVYAHIDGYGHDSHAYWATGHHAQLYGIAPGGYDAFNYSPAFAQAVWPLTQLPWPVFYLVWVGLEVAAFLWLLRPLGWLFAVPLTLVCASEWTIGNVVPFLAVAAVLGMRRPGWWAAVVLMKPTMALGPVWLAARGEWRKVGVTCAVTAAVVAVSAAVDLDVWRGWVGFLLDAAGEQSAARFQVPRVVVAVLVTVYAARTDRAWLLLCAMLLASPVWGDAATVTLLAGLPRMVSERRKAAHPRRDGRLKRVSGVGPV